MILIPMAAYFCIYMYIYKKHKDIALSFIESFLLFTFFTVIFCEFLSLLHIMNLLFLSLCWLFSGIVFLFLINKNNSLLNICSNIFNDFKATVNHNKLLSFFVFVIISITIARAALYPPQNVDSLCYHLSRAFYYYKNCAIENFPSSYAWSNYTGPMNAIFMAQLLIFLKGNDFLHNFIQLIPWLVSAFTVYKISNLLGTSTKWSFFSFILALTLPEAVLQAATTQCDLLMACFCTTTVYYMLKVYTSDSISLYDMLFIGISGGAAILSKISAGIVLISFVFFFIIFIIFIKRNFKSIIITALSALSIVICYWTRTAIDLNGDFLALNYSSAMSGANSNLLTTVIGRLTFNLGYLLGGNNIQVSGFVDRFLKNIGLIFGVTEVDPLTFTTFTQYISHDEYPYPIHFISIISAAIIILIVSLYQKNKLHFLYTLCSLTALLGIAVSIEAGITSISRYAMGPVFLLIAIVPCVFSNFNSQKFTNDILKPLAHFIIISVSIHVVFISLLDSRQSPIFVPNSYEQMRNKSYYGLGYDTVSDIYLDIIEENNYTNIGFYEEYVNGYYPVQYMFGENKYTVKSVYGHSAQTHLDQSFIPDCIVFVGDKNCTKLTVNGETYYIATESSQLLFNNAYTALFVRE